VTARALETDDGRWRWRLTMPNCLECDAEIVLAADVEAGEIVECRDCGSEFEVTSVQPPELAPAPKEEEDWGE
jgi:alpha-aminoadipate carrier protein LysW